MTSLPSGFLWPSVDAQGRFALIQALYHLLFHLGTLDGRLHHLRGPKSWDGHEAIVVTDDQVTGTDRDIVKHDWEVDAAVAVRILGCPTNAQGSSEYRETDSL